MKLFLGIVSAACISLSFESSTRLNQHGTEQKVILFMLDGFGEEYYRASDMPTLNRLEKQGLHRVVPSLMPSVTNVNNAAICTGELPERNGITGNSFYDLARGTEEFMESDTLLLAPTLFERAKRSGVRSRLFSSKKKTIGLLLRGTDEVLSPESASAEWIARLGKPPEIYSREVNYWLMEAALYRLKQDPAMGLLYVHTTDYPMHTWAPESQESKEHLHEIDKYIARFIEAAPDAMILITADHTVKHKNACWDLEKACANRKTPIKIAISPDRDKYFKQHRGLGGASYVYLKSADDLKRVRETIRLLKGVEEVLTREEAVSRFHLMPQRIGDLTVLGDLDTVFGDLDNEFETLPQNYRTHGSLHEAHVPVFVYNAHQSPPADYFTSNYKLASWLYRK